MTPKNRNLIILILGLLSAVGPFSIDMYLPGFPAIAKSLGVTTDMVSYSLSSYFLGLCIGQLLWGPLLDRFGRKIPLMIGLCLYLFATAGCAFADDVYMLIGLRFLQALGGCVGIVAPRAMIRDFFPVEENAKIFSLLILILGISPILAPTAGGFIVAHFGWHAIFITLVIIAGAVLAMVFFLLPESYGADPGYSLKPKPILQKFRSVLRNKQFVVFSLTGALASSALYAYLSGSPFVFIQYFKTTEKMYGYIFSIIAVGLIVCSQLNNILLKKYTSSQIIHVTMALQASIGVVLFVGTASGYMSLVSTIVLIALFLSCQGFTFPNASALGLAPFTKNAGSASALMGSMQMAVGALASACVGLLHQVDAIPMTFIMMICGLLAVLVLRIGSYKEHFSIHAVAKM